MGWSPLHVCLQESSTEPYRSGYYAYSEKPETLTDVCRDRLTYVNALVSAGGKLNAKDSNSYNQRHGGGTPLMLAVKWMQGPSIETLIGLGADVNMKDSERMTALHHVLENKLPHRHYNRNAAETVRYPTDLKAKVDRTTEIVSALIRAGADTNVKDSRGLTPLLLALSKKQYQKHRDTPLFSRLFELLIQGSNLSVRSRKGNSAAMLAAPWASADFMRALLDAAGTSLNLNWRDEDGRTALILAVNQKSPIDQIETCKLLLERGAKPNFRDVQNRTALGTALFHLGIGNEPRAFRELFFEYGGRA